MLLVFLKTKPQHPDTLVGLGHVVCEQNNLELAKQHNEEAPKIDARYADALIRL